MPEALRIKMEKKDATKQLVNMYWCCRVFALLPFHPLSQQLLEDLAHQVDQGNLDVLAHHLVLSLQLVPTIDNRDKCLTFIYIK